MQNHALSLADDGWEVELIGYSESTPRLTVQNHPKITIRALPTPWKLPRSPKLLYVALIIPAAVTRALSLFWALTAGGVKGVLLVQNPPSIPTLLVARLAASFWHGAALAVDWHNYGYTIMETTGAPRLTIAVARFYEKLVGPWADIHFCVAKSMREDLAANWGIPGALVLYDKAPASFGPTPLDQAKELHERLQAAGATKMSDFYDEQGRLRPERPALVVSSTSWTPDEDFSMFLDALVLLDASLSGQQGGKATAKAPPKKVLQVIITGKGPTQAAFLERVATTPLRHVDITTAWLTAEDYPLLLGAADLGVSLHYSSSGLDLPMKVVDMFGTGLPVCQVQYKCIDELVQHDQNGFLFQDAKQLSEQLRQLLADFTLKNGVLGVMRANLERFRARKWEQEWLEVAAGALQGAVSGGDSAAHKKKAK